MGRELQETRDEAAMQNPSRVQLAMMAHKKGLATTVLGLVHLLHRCMGMGGQPGVCVLLGHGPLLGCTALLLGCFLQGKFVLGCGFLLAVGSHLLRALRGM